MNPTPALAVLLALAFAPTAAAQRPDPRAVEAELRTMFDRPAGTPIAEPQKEKLAAFLQRHEGQDLGTFGYARALHLYLQRDYDGALAAADAFLAEHDAVPIAEHATMMGRISMMGMMRGTDAAARARHAEHAARLYPDTAMLIRAMPRALGDLDDEGRVVLRLAVARGALASEREETDRDALIVAAYAPAAAGAAPARAAIPATPLRAVPAAPGAAEARERAEARRAALTDTAAPALSIETVIGGASDLSLAGLRGKVVVLDFTATWCGPCRKVIPAMIALQKAHSGDLQVLAVTRLYGYGSDFRGEADGAMVRGIDRATELELNRAFAEHFELSYPVAVVPEATTKELYGVTGIPTVFVIGRNGEVVGHAVGAGDESHARVEELVRAALGR